MPDLYRRLVAALYFVSVYCPDEELGGLIETTSDATMAGLRRVRDVKTQGRRQSAGVRRRQFRLVGRRQTQCRREARN
jgi:hypothetical protein